jgi:class 3 adenylate cyclase
MKGIDLAGAGLPEGLALRVGAHLGPVFETHDPVLKTPSFCGTHVTRTARIEPTTPPGQVYVTEAFAARLALERPARLTAQYVGQMPSAKGYGLMRMYVLRPNDGPAN